jgi:hypothetical protein
MAVQVWSQVEPSATGGVVTQEDGIQMQTPPIVSGEAYPTVVGSEMRSNYLAAGFILSTAYDDNVLADDNTVPVSDVSYTVWPTITLDQTTPRQRRTLTYSPGFTFYQPTSALNEVDQNVVLNFRSRLSQNTALRIGDSLQKISNVFNRPDPLSGGAISGSIQSPPAEIIAPFADRISNTTYIVLSYQFSKNEMIGAGGNVTELNYLNSNETPGFFNSYSRGGSGFYSHRLSSTQYVGATYQYLRNRASPANGQANPTNAVSKTRAHSLLALYTIYFNGELSLSLAAGPQYYDAAQLSTPSSRSWIPAALASIGWQERHTVLSADYTRTVTGGVGLPGAFESNSANINARWQLTHTWTIGSAGSYSVNKNVTPLFPASVPGGHTVLGGGTVQHSLSEHLRAEFGYFHLHQKYTGIAVLASMPDSDRVYFSVSYQLTKPLGR